MQAQRLPPIGDIRRFTSPQKLVSYFGLNPRVRQSGLGAAHHGRISKVGRSHARAMLVEAAWTAAKASGPLHAFFVRIRAKRGHQIAAVAVARKLAVICRHLLTKDVDYLWARPALVANKRRAMELQAGRPQAKGNKPDPAHAYNIKTSRNREIAVAGQAERAFEDFVDGWQPKPPKKSVRGRLKSAGTDDRPPGGVLSRRSALGHEVARAVKTPQRTKEKQPSTKMGLVHLIRMTTPISMRMHDHSQMASRSFGILALQ